jgi:hypothetical protein
MRQPRKGDPEPIAKAAGTHRPVEPSRHIGNILLTTG